MTMLDMNKHKLYDHFNDKETIQVKSKSELELLLAEYDYERWKYDHYLKFAEVKTEINQKLYHCCTLDIDKQFTWSYNWIRKENHLEDDLFEI